MPVTNFFWDGDNLLQEYNDAGTTTAQYSTEPGSFGNITSQQRSGQSHFYHCDPVGSTTELTTSSGNVSDTRRYKAFGQTVEQSGSTVFTYQYVGQVGYYLDAERDIYYVRQRDYRAQEGRWLTVDPDGVYDDTNVYRYVKNAPVLHTDPSGRGVFGTPIPPSIAGCGGIAVIIASCWYVESTWDKEHSARPFTQAESNCLNTAFHYVPPFARCGWFAMSSTVPNPITLCHLGCSVTYGFGSRKTYLGAMDVDCSTCSSFINTITTLLHECQLHLLNCAFVTNQLDCAEVIAYQASWHHLDTYVRNRCGEMVANGLCPSELQCIKAIDAIIDFEKNDNTYLTHKSKCGK